MLRIVLGLLLLGGAALAHAEDPTLRFYGYAYDLASGRYLYTEVHEQHVDGDRWLGGSIRYYAPDGTLMGRKTLDFSQSPTVPVYRLSLKARGYQEGISAVGQQIDMFKRVSDSDPQEQRSIPARADMAADSGFHVYIRTHFSDLMAGKTVNFRMVVAGMLDSFKFRIRRVDDTKFEGQPAVHLRVEPDSLLRFVVDPLELVYEPGQRKLLEYRGISNVHDPVSGKAYVVRVDYFSRPPADAPKQLPPLQ